LPAPLHGAAETSLNAHAFTLADKFALAPRLQLR
jgi:hypothetical protein